MNFFNRKPKPAKTPKPLRQIIWNAQLPEEPRTLVPEVLAPENPKTRVPVAAGYLDVEVTAIPVPCTPVNPYRDRAFQAIFSDLLNLGWDLPAKHAQVLVSLLGTDEPRTLEQEFLVTRYLRGMGYQV